jgi:hypothetical protein
MSVEESKAEGSRATNGLISNEEIIELVVKTEEMKSSVSSKKSSSRKSTIKNYGKQFEMVNQEKNNDSFDSDA